MLLSMTGFGDARTTQDGLHLAIEIRTVNNRYLKLNMKCPEKYLRWEPRIEKVIREFISRGTINLNIRKKVDHLQGEYKLNDALLRGYWEQYQSIASKCSMGNQATASPSSLLLLPGVVVEAEDDLLEQDLEQEWKFLETTLRSALKKLCAYRQQEGQSMADDFKLNSHIIEQQLTLIAESNKSSVDEFRKKLHERIQQLLQGTTVSLSETDLIREVAIYADRSDINEEIERLRCHLQQLQVFLNDRESQGRKLEFLFQEFFREINTIGSKSNQVTIAQHVVEIKTAIERMKEMVQNIE